MKYTRKKVVISGNILEIYNYEKPVFYDFKGIDTSLGKVRKKTKEEELEILNRSLRRTKRNVERIVNANAGQYSDNKNRPHSTKFVTLTFAENKKDLSEAGVFLRNFFKRFNYERTGEKINHLRYVAIPEFQKRGAVHYHILFFNLNFIDAKELAKLWPHGFVKINKVDTVSNIGKYMTKYLTKDALDKRLLKRKRYYASRNLYRPSIILNEYQINKLIDIIESLPPQYEIEFESDYQGKTSYMVVDLSEFPLHKDRVLKSL